MRLKQLLSKITCRNVRLSKDVEISGLVYDSRNAVDGSVFFAIRGEKTDGHLFIDEAVRKGAAAVVHSSPLSSPEPDVSYFEVENSRAALSAASSYCFGEPSSRLRVIGVTGTDGKSTTVWFIQQLMTALGEKSGFISTVHVQTGDEILRNPFRQSTPEAPEIHRLLGEMVRENRAYAVIEATSHGLSAKTKRLDDVAFDAGVLTNVTHEHLEFHGSFEQYRNDKANLFRRLGKSGAGVLNRDDPNWGYFSSISEAPSFTYSLVSSEADLFADDIKLASDVSRFRIHNAGRSFETRLSVPGRVNIANILASLLTVSRFLHIEMEDLVPLLPGLTILPGRFEEIRLGQPYRVIIDFAHTPGSFRELFSLIRPQTSGRLIAVFGSAGERDTEKRHMQGELACKYADIIILTDEDPRGEDPMKILKEIAGGCGNSTTPLFFQPDRETAIRTALERAMPGDTVLCLGKGHETGIIYADRTVEWNESEVTRRLVKEILSRHQ